MQLQLDRTIITNFLTAYEQIYLCYIHLIVVIIKGYKNYIVLVMDNEPLDIHMNAPCYGM